MSEVEDLRNEVAALRADLDATIRLLRWEVRQREVIELYLEGLTSSRGWRPWEKRLNAWLPFWGSLHPLRILYREPFSVWADDVRNKAANEVGGGTHGR